MKANDNKLETEKVILPMPPLSREARYEMDVYARFMRHLRCVPSSRMEIKVLSAVQYVADMMDAADGEIAKTLVDLGLRAPRMAFPVEYIDFVDNALMREDWEVGSASASIKELQAHWGRIGEDRLAGFRRYYPALAENFLAPV
ncbi:MAG: hypothetical protein JNN09_06275 [Alphaproteobacteria bacterium]|nr:hypothetical protein [Alphaproteobacteria bacterium]